MGTKSDPGKFDCYKNAETDEPMFILLARDKHAPVLVELWARLKEADGPDSLGKYYDAFQIAADMRAWRKGNRE